MKYEEKWPSRWLLLLVACVGINCAYADEKYNAIHRDGSFEFNYDTPDSFHVANGDRNNVVRGEFGGRNPGTGLIDKTTYTAGPRGYRPRGKNIARKYDLSQIGPRAVGSKDDPYFDPYEDPSYNFAFRTRTYSREENANRFGDVKGSYTYLDDVGERHNVEFIAGKRTGFHVRTPFPDSNPGAYGPLFFNGRGKPIPRGRTAIQRGLDGSYRFISAGPDQRRTETSDATGHVRGSYTYLDNKGVQHSVHYIAGPEIGYRVLKNVKGPHLPTIYPFSRPDIIPPDYYDSFDKAEKELFDTAASGRPRPTGGGGISRPSGGGATGGDYEEDKGTDYEEGAETSGGGAGRPSGPSTSRPQYGGGGKRPTAAGAGGRPRPPKPSLDEYEDGGEDIDLFGGEGGSGSSTTRPTAQDAGVDRDDGYKPSGSDREGEEETFGPGGSNRPSSGGYRPQGAGPTGRPSTGGGSYDDGSYKPSKGEEEYKPSQGDGAYRPSGGEPGGSEGAYKPNEGEEGGTYRPSRPRPSSGGGTFEGESPSDSGVAFDRPRPSGGGGTLDSSRPSVGGYERPGPSSEGNYGLGGDQSKPSGAGDGAGGGYRPSGSNIRPTGGSGDETGEGDFGSTAAPEEYDTGVTGDEGGNFGGASEGSGSTTRPSAGEDYGGGVSRPTTNFGSSTLRPEGFPTGSTARPGIFAGGASTSRPDSYGRPSVSTYRPSRPTRPPFGGDRRPRPRPRPGGVSRPQGGGFNDQVDEEDFNLFGSESSGPVSRPGQVSSTTVRPSDEGGFFEGASESDFGAGFDESGDKGRPQKRPPYGHRPRPSSAGGFARPSGGSDFGVQGNKGGGVKPDFGASEGSSGGSRPELGSSGGQEEERPAVIGVSSGGGSFYERGTIVTNLGDKVFSVPPGVSVRAHVQAIDLLPLGSRIPSPSEQYRAETTAQSEQLKEASEKVTVAATTTTASSVDTTYNDEEDIFK